MTVADDVGGGVVEGGMAEEDCAVVVGEGEDG